MFTLGHFVVLCALVLTAYCDDCSCRDEKTIQEMEEFRKFLLGLPEDHDYTKFPIVPGELSPYVCNCIPKDRRKRKVVETPQWVQDHHVHTPRKPAPRRRMSHDGRIICAYGHRFIPVLNICVAH